MVFLRLSILLMILWSSISCTRSKADPSCLDGYIIVDISGRVNVFCEKFNRGNLGITGIQCSEIPAADSDIALYVILKEGVVFPVKCFNRLNN